jgi:hypothetical protein
MSVNEQAASFGRLVAKCQNGFDVGFLRQQNVRTGLDRIMEAQGRPKVGIERPEGFRIRLFGVKNRQNMGDPTALVADEFVKSANGEGWKGGRLHRRAPRGDGRLSRMAKAA